MARRLYRVEQGRMIAGVCGGLAEYFNMDPSLVRILSVLLVFGWGTGFIAYIVAAIILPNKSQVM